MTPRSFWRLLEESATAWSNDYASSMGAALAYYTLFSLAPLLVIVIAIAGFVFGDEAASGQIQAQLTGLIGNEGAIAVQGLLQSAREPASSLAASALGILVLMIGATSVFAEVQSAIDRIWRVPSEAAQSGLWGLLRARLLSFGMVLTIGFLLLVSLVVSAVLSAAGTWWGPALAGWKGILQGVNFAASFTIITVLFALIYKILPRVRLAWRDVWIGAAVTALLFTLGKSLIGLYLGKSSIASSFGAAGSLVALLVWVYYSAQVFLFGVEFTWVYAHRFGSFRSEHEPSKPVVVPAK